MPSYRFTCATHGDFTRLLPMSSESGELGKQPCPDCGESSPRCYETTPVHFRGRGFHVTDHGSHNAASN